MKDGLVGAWIHTWINDSILTDMMNEGMNNERWIDESPRKE